MPCLRLYASIFLPFLLKVPKGNCSIPWIVSAALFWTYPNSTASYLGWGEKNCTQYSKCGRSIDLYNVILILVILFSIPFLMTTWCFIEGSTYYLLNYRELWTQQVGDILCFINGLIANNATAGTPICLCFLSTIINPAICHLHRDNIFQKLEKLRRRHFTSVNVSPLSLLQQAGSMPNLTLKQPQSLINVTLKCTFLDL